MVEMKRSQAKAEFLNASVDKGKLPSPLHERMAGTRAAFIVARSAAAPSV